MRHGYEYKQRDVELYRSVQAWLRGIMPYDIIVGKKGGLDMNDYDDDRFDSKQFRKDMEVVGKASLIILGVSILIFIVYADVSLRRGVERRRAEYEQRVANAQKVLREQLKEYYGLSSEQYEILQSSYGDHGLFPEFDIAVGDKTFHAYVSGNVLYTDYLAEKITLDTLKLIIESEVMKAFEGTSINRSSDGYSLKDVTIRIPEGHGVPAGQYLPAWLTEQELERFKNGESRSDKWRKTMSNYAYVVISGNKDKLTKEQFTELQDKIFSLYELTVVCDEGTYEYYFTSESFAFTSKEEKKK